jgi:hypothetical protein
MQEMKDDSTVAEPAALMEELGVELGRRWEGMTGVVAMWTVGDE